MAKIIEKIYQKADEKHIGHIPAYVSGTKLYKEAAHTNQITDYELVKRLALDGKLVLVTADGFIRPAEFACSDADKTLTVGDVEYTFA